MDFSELETRELGTYFEHLIMSKLIKLGFEVFIPLLDKGIDLVARKIDNNTPKYFEIQVKTVRRKGGRLTINPKTFRHHKNLYLFFFDVKGEEDYDAYVIPSEIVCKGKDKNGNRIFRDQEQKKKTIYRLYTSKGDLRKIEKFKWDFKSVPKDWL